MVLIAKWNHQKLSEITPKNQILVNFGWRLCWTRLRLCLLLRHHWELSSRPKIPERRVQLFPQSCYFSWLFRAFSVDSSHSSSSWSGRVFGGEIRWTHTLTEQDLVYLESQISQWAILRCFAHSHSLGYSWVLEPILPKSAIGSCLPIEGSLHRQHEKRKRILEKDLKKSSHHQIFWTWFPKVWWSRLSHHRRNNGGFLHGEVQQSHSSLWKSNWIFLDSHGGGL